jgi:photosystem II stability/assembly factor-like uncharacterized protein
VNPSRLACLSLLLLSASAPAPADPDPGLQALQWRLAGPFTGGRVIAIVGIPGDGHVFYMGAADGGIWKTTDAGHSWNNVGDCCLDVGPVGALAVAPSDSKVIYAGTGEPFPRGDVFSGDGLWKSVDAGKTWIHAGLVETRIISNVVVDPKDPQHVYVGAMGHLFGPNPERGVYESKDGGAHWQQVLFVDADTGTADLVMDPNDPKTLYAALWQVQRLPWNFSSGGPGSGIWKTSDGGAHWTNIALNPGMAKGPLGRIGLSAPVTAPGRIYAVVEAGDGGLYRSDDGGAHWQHLYQKHDLNQRAWYFSRIYADTKDADHLYVTQAAGLMISKDGGKTFKSQYMIGGDHHALWIDPSNPQTLGLANDGGASVSLDGGASWSSQDNQPISQFYRISVDDRFPFHMFAAKQDRGTMEVASASQDWGIGTDDWHMVAQWESGYAVPAPDQPWIVYAGGAIGGTVTRSDTRTGLRVMLPPWPDDALGRGAGELKYRFQWTFPIVASVHASDTLYIGSQYVMKSSDGGHNWKEISPDLTRDDKTKQLRSGGPVHVDSISVEYYDTVFAIAESPLKTGLLWAGTDDGRVWLTQDDGGHWQEVTPPDLPEWSTVNTLEASRFEPGTAYLAAQRYRLDDFLPYIYATHDYGQHWQKIVAGLPTDTTSFTVREDWQDPALLFAGTLTGAYFSNDSGVHWQSLQQNLPRVAVTDLAVVPQQDALAAGTHGRSFWVLDQLQPLREITAQTRSADAWLYTPGTAWITPVNQDPSALQYNLGENPVNGASVFYQLKKPLVKGAKLTLSFSDLQGKILASFSITGGPPKKAHDADDGSFDPNAGPPPPQLDDNPGMNLFVWDLSYASLGSGDEATPGPQVPPGRYRVTLTVGKAVQTREFEVRKDPRIAASDADLQALTSFMLDVQKTLGKIGDANRHIGALREALKKSHAADALARLAALEQIAAKLVTPHYDGYLENLAHPASLEDRLGTMDGIVNASYARPSAANQALFDSLKAQVDEELQALHSFDDLHVHDPAASRMQHPATKRAQDRDDDLD